MKDLLPQLGSRLKAIRKTRGLTQEALAEKIDLSPQHLSRLEGGHQSPSLETVARLAEALNLELSELFDFGHQGTVKEVRVRLRKLIHESSEEELRLGLKLLLALTR